MYIYIYIYIIIQILDAIHTHKQGTLSSGMLHKTKCDEPKVSVESEMKKLNVPDDGAYTAPKHVGQNKSAWTET